MLESYAPQDLYDGRSYDEHLADERKLQSILKAPQAVAEGSVSAAELLGYARNSLRGLTQLRDIWRESQPSEAVEGVALAHLQTVLEAFRVLDAEGWIRPPGARRAV